MRMCIANNEAEKDAKKGPDEAEFRVKAIIDIC